MSSWRPSYDTERKRALRRAITLTRTEPSDDDVEGTARDSTVPNHDPLLAHRATATTTGDRDDGLAPGTLRLVTWNRDHLHDDCGKNQTQ